MSLFPNPTTGQYKDAGWQTQGDELRSLLTEEEYASAKRTTFNAFYTSPVVMRAMHAALARLGVTPTATVLEPGCGIGNFIAHAPSSMRFLGVELDSISARIARLLHPTADIRHENFCNTRLPRGHLDAVVGNVPFADLKLDYDGLRLPLQDYFIAKSLDALNPGGVLAVVTSRFTLDRLDATLRKYLAERADLVGAIRLPSSAFQREGTQVVTDILFLRRRAVGQAARHADPAWLSTEPLTIDNTSVPINAYFHHHPEMVLGTYSTKNSLYADGISVQPNGELAEQLNAAIARLPALENKEIPPTTKDKPAEEPPPAPQSPLPAERPPENHITEGSFLVENRRILQLTDGVAVPVEYGGKTLTSDGSLIGRRLAALVGLRDRARRVLQSQNEAWPATERQAARRILNDAYDRFVAQFGPINKTTFGETSEGSVIRRMPNLVKFREDPDAMLVMSLEEYDEASHRAEKAAILRTDVVGRTPPVTSVATAEEGLLVSLNERGLVDLPFIAKLYDKPTATILEELGDLIYFDPESKEWQTADGYLSGNVRAKLAAAEKAGPRFARNVAALRAVQPEDVLPGDIDANLGAPWIPESDIRDFAAELFGVPESAIRVGHLPKDAIWSIEADYSAEQSVAAKSDYGTKRANGVSLLDQALNLKTPTIYDTISDGDNEVRVVNQPETLAAREKQRQIKERFKAWIFADHERTERLVRTYNDTYNNLRLRRFDGSHLEFPGMNRTIELRSNQTDAVWRGMTSGNTLLAHCVGAGKTFTMATTGMKMKQAGLIQKPLYVVPNHMLEQFAREFMQLYPTAKLLVAGKDDFTRERRKRLTAQMASGQWDGIIVTHSSFERIGMSRDYQEQFIRQQIAEYEEMLIDRASCQHNPNRNIIKTLEKQKLAWEERLKNLLAESKKDDGLVFDELGIDHVFIDESQYYKNLETPTKMERVAGIQTGGSQRAFDLYMKTRYLDGLKPGHGLTFATGTPISNTMVELYTLQRLLDPAGLRSRGIEHFDAWGATFGEVVEAMEISPDGASLRPRSRFAKFMNLPELQQMFRSFSDVQTAQMLDLPRPKLTGGKPTVIACPMSAEQKELQTELVSRYERLRSERVDPRVDNALNITTDGRKLALDPRLLSADSYGHTDCKINVLADNVARIWRETAPNKGTQLVFCDLGIRQTAWGFSVYDHLIDVLVDSGIPKDQIATIGEADSDAKKQALFEKVRNGTVRILIGSTQKMGTGTNVQKRLVALHHLDAPWKPAEVEQRDGRILRQGNSNPEVAIYRYVTEGSFDAYMWQALETKARFISQVMTGDSAVRRAEDIGGQEFSYAEVKAIASGNPAVLTLAEAEAELQRLAVLKSNHADEQYLARRNVRDLPTTINTLEQRLAGLKADYATATNHDDERIVIGDRPYGRSEANDVLASKLQSLPERITSDRQIPLGKSRGLSFGLLLSAGHYPQVYVEGQTTRYELLSGHRPGSRAVLNGLDRLFEDYPQRIAKTERDLTLAQSQLADYQARVGLPFPHASYLADLSSLRDKLKAVLAKSETDADGKALASAAELAAQIKQLRATKAIEPVPQRLAHGKATAEQPATRRIVLKRSHFRCDEPYIAAPDDWQDCQSEAEANQAAQCPAEAGQRNPANLETDTDGFYLTNAERFFPSERSRKQQRSLF